MFLLFLTQIANEILVYMVSVTIPKKKTGKHKLNLQNILLDNI